MDWRRVKSSLQDKISSNLITIMIERNGASHRQPRQLSGHNYRRLAANATLPLGESPSNRQRGLVKETNYLHLALRTLPSPSVSLRPSRREGDINPLPKIEKHLPHYRWRETAREDDLGAAFLPLALLLLRRFFPELPPRLFPPPPPPEPEPLLELPPRDLL